MTRGPLLDPVLGGAALGEALSDAAWVRALLDVEAALSRAAARHGVLAPEHAAEVTWAAAALDVDVPALGRAAAAAGNPVLELVRLLRAAADVPPAAVHPGATSQDVVDTALVLLLRRAAPLALADLAGAADAAADLARTHRDTACAARTLGQQAVPSTVGALAAGWCDGLDHARTRLAEAVAALPVSLGGAAGTLAALHPHGLAVADALADELGLPRQGVPWHTERSRVVDLATALGGVAAAVSKPATDVVLLAMTEVGEVSEAHPGGSSAMAHKANPVAAVTARAAARRVPGLVATALASADHELARATGGWHAEWETLSDLLRLAGGAAHQLRRSLTGLVVHPERCAANLALTGTPALAGTPPRTGHAGEIVDRTLAARPHPAPPSKEIP